MKNKSALLVGSLLSIISCNLHDTSYLQAGDPKGRGGSAGNDSAGSGAPGAGAGAGADGIGDSGEGGAGQGGAAESSAGQGGAGEGGDRSPAGSATGGSNDVGAGAAGPCDDAAVACASSDMITDFESNDGRLCVLESGTVIAYGDGTGTQSPAIGDVRSFDASDDCERGSAFALHAVGAGSTDYGFGIALRFPQNVDAVAAGYKGIRFKAKAGQSRKISIKVATPATLDASFGGSCEPTKSPEKLCNDHPAAAVVVATGGWVDYQVTFASLKQEGWGVPATVTFDAVAQIHVVFPGSGSGGSKDYDIWLDDFTFYE